MSQRRWLYTGCEQHFLRRSHWWSTRGIAPWGWLALRTSWGRWSRPWVEKKEPGDAGTSPTRRMKRFFAHRVPNPASPDSWILAPDSFLILELLEPLPYFR